MTSQETINNCKSKMQKAFEVFKNDLSSLRTGRANVNMLDTVKVDVYGQMIPINHHISHSYLALFPKHYLSIKGAF